MGIYSTFKDGYAKEASFAVGTTIDSADDTAYLWGLVNQESVHNIRSSVNYRAPGVNAKETPTANIFKGRIEVDGMYGLIMQNGILLWAAMGKHSDTEDTGVFTHTIGPNTDGSLLPSFAIHHERKGTATDKAYTITGMKIKSLMLSHNLTDPNVLMAKVEWMAKKAVKAGFTLTNDPALPATATATPYVELTRTFNSVSIDGLEQVEVIINNGLTGHWAHTYDSGTYTGRWLRLITEANRKEYIIRMMLHPSTLEDDLFDEIVASGTEYDLVLKWAKSTNDYIQITASGLLTESPYTTPEAGLRALEEVVFEPRALAIEVKDTINGITHYGDSA